ncbi:hypothetical protein I3760_07G176700 [Carya illinoinensis]|nr:hypothetical protein I3760_07G176700 [Carya illinoinensis]
MSDSLSITVEPSPKVGLPVWHSPMEEAKGSRLRESAIRADTSPSVLRGCSCRKIQTLSIVGIAAVWGLTLMALIYALAHVSGAHFNPAVTIAFAAASKFPWKHVPMYALSQVLAAALASLTLRVLFHGQDNTHAATTQYSDSTTDLEAIAWEFIISFILMFNISGVASDHRAVR